MSKIKSLLEGTKSLTSDEAYYEYVPDRLRWNQAQGLCSQRRGALATVSHQVETRELMVFLKSLNITHPVWIARKVLRHLTSMSIFASC